MQKNHKRILEANASYLEGMHKDTRYPDFHCNAVLDIVEDLRNAAKTMDDKFVEFDESPSNRK